MRQALSHSPISKLREVVKGRLMAPDDAGSTSCEVGDMGEA